MYLGGRLRYFVYVNPYLGEDLQFDEHFFAGGWVETTN